MTRKILGPLGAFVAWWAVATVLDRSLRLAWPEYAVAFPTLAFTLGMRVARLVEGAVCTLASGAVAAWISRRSSGAAVATGVLLLVFFVPTHAMIWSRFPVWYHVVFLCSLLPLTMLGARATGRRDAVGG
jgi:hypothetical protein